MKSSRNYEWLDIIYIMYTFTYMFMDVPVFINTKEHVDCTLSWYKNLLTIKKKPTKVSFVN